MVDALQSERLMLIGYEVIIISIASRTMIN